MIDEKIKMVLARSVRHDVSAAQRRRSSRFHGRSGHSRFAGTWRFDDYVIL
jgi:hypothetical protein